MNITRYNNYKIQDLDAAAVECDRSTMIKLTKKFAADGGFLFHVMPLPNERYIVAVPHDRAGDLTAAVVEEQKSDQHPLPSPWGLFDGKSSSANGHQLVMAATDWRFGVLNMDTGKIEPDYAMGKCIAEILEDTPEFGEWTPTARLIVEAPRLLTALRNLGNRLVDETVPKLEEAGLHQDTLQEYEASGMTEADYRRSIAMFVLDCLREMYDDIAGPILAQLPK